MIVICILLLSVGITCQPLRTRPEFFTDLIIQVSDPCEIAEQLWASLDLQVILKDFISDFLSFECDS